MNQYLAYILLCSDNSYYTGVTNNLAFEKQIKGWRRAKKEAIINGDWDLLPELASIA